MDSQGLRPRIDLRWPPEFRSRSCSLSSGDVSSSPVNGLVGERLGWERYAVWSGVSSGKSGSESVTSGGDTATFERGLESFREPWKVWAVMPRTVLGVAIGLPPSSSSVTWVAPDAVTPKRCKGRLPPATGELLMPKDVHIRIGCRRALFDTLAKARGEFQSLAAEGDCSSQVRNLVSAFLLGAGRDGPYGLAAIFFLDRIGLDRDGVKKALSDSVAWLLANLAQKEEQHGAYDAVFDDCLRKLWDCAAKELPALALRGVVWQDFRARVRLAHKCAVEKMYPMLALKRSTRCERPRRNRPPKVVSVASAALASPIKAFCDHSSRAGLLFHVTQATLVEWRIAGLSALRALRLWEP